MPEAINKVIRVLIYSDLIINSALGLVGPIFAIFLLEKITVGSTEQAATLAGFASLTYWVLKSLLQIPIGKYLDKNHGEKDDLWAIIIGTLISALANFGFVLASQVWHIYAIEAMNAIGMAMVVPSWSAIFTRHIDKGKEAFEWSVRSTSLGFGAGIAGAVGGVLAARFGFAVVFSAVAILSIISALLLLLIQNDVVPKDKILSKVARARMPF